MANTDSIIHPPAWSDSPSPPISESTKRDRVGGHGRNGASGAVRISLPSLPTGNTATRITETSPGGSDSGASRRTWSPSPEHSWADLFPRMGEKERYRLLRTLCPNDTLAERNNVLTDWRFWGRGKQQEPPGTW